MSLLSSGSRGELSLLPNRPGANGAVSTTGEQPATPCDQPLYVARIHGDLVHLARHRPGKVPLRDLVAPRAAEQGQAMLSCTTRCTSKGHKERHELRRVERILTTSCSSRASVSLHGARVRGSYLKRYRPLVAKARTQPE